MKIDYWVTAKGVTKMSFDVFKQLKLDELCKALKIRGKV